MKQLMQYIVDNNLGDVASIAGVLLSLIGFAATLYAVFKSQSASKQARDAAEATREALTRFETVAKISATITSMSEIKRLHRVAAWPILPDRYASVRQELVLIRSANPEMDANQRTALQGAIQQFSELEQTIETYLSYSNRATPRASKLNNIVSLQIDKLNEILDSLRQESGAIRNV